MIAGIVSLMPGVVFVGLVMGAVTPETSRVILQ